MILSKCSGGIGDEVKALYVLSGIKARFPNEHLVFYSSIPNWFSDVEGIEIRDIRSYQRSEGPLINPLDFYQFELEGRATRSQVYLHAFPSRFRDCIVSPPKCDNLYGADAKKVVLCPYVNHQERNWDVDKMILLERMLNERGIDTVVLGTSFRGGGGERVLDYGGFRSDVKLDLPISEVREILKEASMVVSGDSGMAHYAVMHGVPVSVIMAQFPFEHVYGDYGDLIRPVPSRLGCVGCRCGGPNFTHHCRTSCAALNEVTAQRVLSHILRRRCMIESEVVLL